VIHSTSVAVSREKRRAKTDRVDAEMLLRVFRAGCAASAATAPWSRFPPSKWKTRADPARTRGAGGAERTRIINRMKADMARLVVHGFKPHLRSAPKKLGSVRTPEGVAVPPNTKAELERDMRRLAVLREQIVAIEKARLERIKNAPDNGAPRDDPPLRPSPWSWHRDGGHAGERGDDAGSARTAALWRVTPGSPGRPTRAGRGGAKRASPRRATRASDAA